MSGLLRAQLAVSLLGPTVHASETVRRAQSQLISPHSPRDRGCLASLLNDAGYWAEGGLRPTEQLLASGGESQLSAIILGAYSFQRRFTRRRWLPRLASPAATHRVETCHPRKGCCCSPSPAGRLLILPVGGTDRHLRSALPSAPGALEVPAEFPRDLPVGIALGHVLPLVVRLLAARQAQLDLCPTVGEVKRERNQR